MTKLEKIKYLQEISARADKRNIKEFADEMRKSYNSYLKSDKENQARARIKINGWQA